MTSIILSANDLFIPFALIHPDLYLSITNEECSACPPHDVCRDDPWYAFSVFLFCCKKNQHFAGMVDTGLGKKSLPSWLWFSLKPLRYLLLKHPDEGTFVIYFYKT